MGTQRQRDRCLPGAQIGELGRGGCLGVGPRLLRTVLGETCHSRQSEERVQMYGHSMSIHCIHNGYIAVLSPV